MPHRRRFLKIAALGTAAAALARCTPRTEAPFGESPTPTGMKPEGTPLFLSTWNHGLAANARALEVLQNGGSILDAVEQGVRVTEADFSNRSVGLGGHPDRDGHVTLDACIMNHNSQCGAVCFLENIDHPISVARAIMERTPHVMLAGLGAYKWALENGFTRTQVENPLPEVRRDWEKWKEQSLYKPVVNIENHDTIGLIGIDAQGRMAGACTTSGMAYKVHGRVGDSPIIGAGLFIDGDVGAATATGVGEAVIRVAGCSAVVELMRAGAHPADACREVTERILRKHPQAEGLQVGFIAINTAGNYGGYSVYNGFNYAVTTPQSHRMEDADYKRTWA